MRAIVVEDYGTGPLAADIDEPAAGPGQIRVRVRASSLNVAFCRSSSPRCGSWSPSRTSWR